MKEFSKDRSATSRKYIPVWLAKLITGAFVLHFSAVLLSSLGGNYLPLKYWYAVSGYIDPLFYQNFRVFAPEPPTESRILVFRFHTEHGWSQWHWPGVEHLLAVRQNRLSNHSELFDAVEGLGDNLRLSMQKPSFFMASKPEGFARFPAFDACYSAARQYAEVYSPDADSSQFGLLIEHTFLVNDSIMTSHEFQDFPTQALR